MNTLGKVHGQTSFPAITIKGQSPFCDLHPQLGSFDAERTQQVFLTAEVIVYSAFGIVTGSHQLIHGQAGKAFCSHQPFRYRQQLLLTIGNSRLALVFKLADEAFWL